MTAKTPAALAREAERLCRRRALRLTALRRRVLLIVAAARKPPGAYDILRKLGGGARPPTAYRALDFLVEHGFLHKIKTLGAYVACPHPHRNHTCYFLVCAACGKCDECCTRRLDGAIAAAAAGGGFAARAATVEIEGVCRNCRAKQ